MSPVNAVAVSLYELIPRQPLNALTLNASPRRGALLRINGGYADLHPWPELGDAILEIHLESIKKGTPTLLAQRAIYFAGIDASARAKGITAFAAAGLSESDIPLSHYLVTEQSDDSKVATLNELIQQKLSEGFVCFKFKCGRSVDYEATALNLVALKFPRIVLRLDFNGAFSEGQFLEFWKQLELSTRKQIEFIEDPFLRVDIWTKTSRELDVQFAADNLQLPTVAPEDFPLVKVIKPAREDASEAAASGRKVCITSSLDHPLGQVAAAFEAARLLKHRPETMLRCGLLSHHSYQPNSFSVLLSASGPSFLLPSGTGFGFDSVLESLQWQSL